MLDWCINKLWPRPLRCDSGTEDEFMGKQPDFQTFSSPLQLLTSRWDFVKGFKFDFSSGLTPYFMLSHSWAIPHASPAAPQMSEQERLFGGGKAVVPSYTLSTQFTGLVEGNVPHLILSTRSDSQGKLDFILHRRLSQRWVVKLTSSFPGREIVMSQTLLDLCHEDKDQSNVLRVMFTAMDSMYSFSTFQRISKALSLGFSYMLMPSRKTSLWSYGGQLALGGGQLYFSYLAMNQTYVLGYLRQLRKGTTLFSKYEVAPMGMGREVKTTGLAGLRQKYESSEITMLVNSRAKVSTMLGLTTQIITLRLCAIADFYKDKYKFGYGVSIGNN